MFIVTFVWLPESPYFLLMRGREEDAGRSLAWLRGEDSTEAIATELEKMRHSVEAEIKEKVRPNRING